MALLKFILYAVVFYYCFVFLSRFLASFFLTRWMNKIKKDVHSKSKESNYKKHQEGDTEVSYKKVRNASTRRRIRFASLAAPALRKN